jgi:hypothetical protein
MLIDLLTSLVTIHNGHVKIEQNKIYFLIWVLLNVLENLKAVASFFKNLDIKGFQVVRDCHHLKVVIVGNEALVTRFFFNDIMDNFGIQYFA